MKFNSLKSSSLSVSIVQFLSTILSVLGIFYYSIDNYNIIEIMVGYFLFSCIGISIFYHRYFSHRSFETSKYWEFFGIICGILAGRGSPIGWVYVHRIHHKFSDIENDPHPHTWKIFFPHLLKYGDHVNPFYIKDFIKSSLHKKINEYYNLILLSFVLLFGLLGFKFLLFFWIIPVALTAWSLNLFVYMSHYYGYINYECNDNSKNNWFISLILWGEGWHNNHHQNPGWWNLHKKWWEIDISGMVINMIRNR